MSSEDEQIRRVAERVARRLSEDGGGAPPDASAAEPAAGELSDLRAGLADIQRRLVHIESHVGHDETCGHGRSEAQPPRAQRPGQPPPTAATTSRPTWLSGTYVPVTGSHPSQERFAGIGEAVSELVDFFESEKTCTVEPGGKPCDHCGMCSSRGF